MSIFTKKHGEKKERKVSHKERQHHSQDSSFCMYMDRRYQIGTEIILHTR